MTKKNIFVGTDIGASRTKSAIINKERELIGHAVTKSGTDFAAAAEFSLKSALAKAEKKRSDIARSISTGYGRRNAVFADDTRTEIGCHARGCYHYFPKAITIIDIGGQDNKIIKLDDKGARKSFKMNRKCAAGTGAFLEEMSLRLNIPLDEMNGLAEQSTNMVRLGSFCTVFSGTEVLKKIRQGKKTPDIVKGLFFSVIQRVMEMDTLTGHVVMTGGVVAHNPYLATMAEAQIGRKILTAMHPQLTGAVGAALYALEGTDG